MMFGGAKGAAVAVPLVEIKDSEDATYLDVTAVSCSEHVSCGVASASLACVYAPPCMHVACCLGICLQKPECECGRGVTALLDAARVGTTLNVKREGPSMTSQFVK